MRKLISFNMLTLDGFFEGANHDISWHNVDEEFNEFAIEQLNSVDTLLFGRVTYKLMASYWPTAIATKNDPIVAGKMNDTPKIVFSKTLNSVEWNNTRLVKENVEDEVSKLKIQQGKDIIIFGSGILTSNFAKLNLIDEFRVMINPVAVGKGNPLFKDINGRIKLELLKTKTFRNGNVLIYYRASQ